MNRKIERAVPFVAAAVGFALTLALYHPDQSAFQSVVVPATPAVVQLTSVPQVDPRPMAIASSPPETSAKSTAPPVKVRTLPNAPVVESNAAAPHLELASKELKEQSEVPVTVHTGGSGGSVANRTGEALHLTLLSGGQRADLTLEAHERKSLLDAGFVPSPGQSITVQSPPYRDLILAQ
jgi:hypothetical protein